MDNYVSLRSRLDLHAGVRHHTAGVFRRAVTVQVFTADRLTTRPLGGGITLDRAVAGDSIADYSRGASRLRCVAPARNQMIRTLRVVLALLLACNFETDSAWADTPASTVQITMGKGGLASLKYGGAEFLWANPNDSAHGAYDGNTFWVSNVILRRADGTETSRDAGGPSQVQVSGQTITRKFAWGTVRGTFVPNANRLSLTIRVANTTKDQTVQAVYLQPLILKFPQAPEGYNGDPRLTNTLGRPAVVRADYGSGALALCSDDLTRPLILGFPYSLDKPANTIYPVQVAGGPTGWLGKLLDPYIKRPIPPGGSDTYTLSLRFGPPSAQNLAADLDRKFAAAFPFQLHWADRRPIGYLMLSSTVPHPAGGLNPRGWFNNDASVDVTTDAGRAILRRRLMDYADNSIKILKAMNAQGAITWDIEGQEFPHATSYIGDPRLVKTLAPEMDVLADAYFAKFQAAGLRVGVCVRPQQFTRAGGQRDVNDPAQIVKLLTDKITHAHRRWGCTLFYVDSNGDPNVPFDAAMFQRVVQALAKQRVNVLLMPEHQNTRYYAYTAPYDELRGGVATTPADVRRVYPEAFEVINVADGPLDARRAELVQAVKRGNILLFRAWFDDAYNAKVKSIYQEAQAKK